MQGVALTDLAAVPTVRLQTRLVGAQHPPSPLLSLSVAVCTGTPIPAHSTSGPRRQALFRLRPYVSPARTPALSSTQTSLLLPPWALTGRSPLISLALTEKRGCFYV